MTQSDRTETVERFEQVINNIAEVFWLTDISKNQVVYISPGYERIWGRACEALYKNPHNWLEAVHPDDREEVARRARTDQVTSAYDVEYRIIRPEGTIRWIRDRAFPVRNNRGEIYRVAGIAEDITMRKEMDAALDEAHELNRSLLKASPIGIAAWKSSGECVMANEALARITGGTVEELLKQNFRELKSWKKSRMLGLADSVLASRDSVQLDYHGVSSFGREMFLHCHLATCLVKGELHLLSAVHDITGQRRAEAALSESESRLRATIHGAPIALFAVDAHGVITFEDGQALPAVRAGSSTNVGRRAAEVYSESPQIMENLERALKGEEFNSFVDVGERSFDCWYLPTRDGKGKVTGVTGVASDITERFRLERQILEITDREQARIGQDLHDGLCQELVSLAFDVRSLHSQLVEEPRLAPQTAKRIAEQIDKAITEAQQVARGLFPIRMEGEGLASALEELAAAASKRFGIDCRFECAQAMELPGEAIATHLYRIGQEAVNNAVKHSRARQLVISLGNRDGRIELLVEDDGRGFASSSTTDSGMGLHIMQYRARTIGARLSVRPRAGGGTVVCCSLERPANR